MNSLAIDLQIERPDDFYETLIAAHRDLAPEESDLLNCKLILLLANHIGDIDVLAAALRRARDGIHPSETP